MTALVALGDCRAADSCGQVRGFRLIACVHFAGRSELLPRGFSDSLSRYCRDKRPEREGIVPEQCGVMPLKKGDHPELEALFPGSDNAVSNRHLKRALNRQRLFAYKLPVTRRQRS
jgi:hypothetical protein